MKQTRGFTILETVVGLSLLVMTFLAVTGMFVSALRSYRRNSSRIDLAQKNAQGLRWVIESIREAATVSLSSDGKTLTYTSPQKSDSVDPLTGEREFIEPIESDGITKTFRVVSGKLTDGGSRVYVSRIANTDPDPASSQYNQVYAPFTLTTIGSKRAITVNLIATETVNGSVSYIRSKTTVMLRNAK
jgi:type II secretory pathway pseudopilin PulG